jgi:hypothetical protein
MQTMSGRIEVRVGDTVFYQGKRCEVIQAAPNSAFLILKELPDGNRYRQAMVWDVRLTRLSNPTDN